MPTTGLGSHNKQLVILQIDHVLPFAFFCLFCTPTGVLFINLFNNYLFFETPFRHHFLEAEFPYSLSACCHLPTPHPSPLKIVRCQGYACLMSSIKQNKSFLATLSPAVSTVQ